MVEGTIIQLNSPKSQGISLSNIDKSEKLKHDRGGLLTIETTGEMSSFGITLSASAQLDSRFTVFGRIVGGFKIIKNVAELGAEEETILRADFEIKSAEVISDAFKEACKKLRRRLLGIDKVKE
jgi:cyclophilin family peptidyl-prolyl cis-trans isomerase